MEFQQLMTALAKGRAYIEGEKIHFHPLEQADLAEKCRQVYHWINEHALYTPFTDIDCSTHKTIRAGGHRIDLAMGASYASFILLPLLTLLTSQRMLLIGAPGRGKTTIATLMGYLAGYSAETMKHTIQHGHPQMTQNDLLGSPLPSDLVNAKTAEAIQVYWRQWLSMRVKVVDEYNRIPTKTQSSLLSLMAEGYAEMYEKIIHTHESAWFLTANDDLGGGTFPVIEALKDRIDIVVRCTILDPQHLNDLARRIETNQSAESFIPKNIIFTSKELDDIGQCIRAIEVPEELLGFLSYFMTQLDFCQQASTQLELKNKDTIHIASKRLGHICTDDCPLDKFENICTQAESGVSTRAYLAIIHYMKALAYFRGGEAVSLNDLRQIIPWTLHEKLTINPQSAFFHKTENQVFLTDRISWIRQMFDTAYNQFIAYAKVRAPVMDIQNEFDNDFPPYLAPEILEKRCRNIQQLIEKILTQQELNAPVHADLILLKKIHAHYQQRLS